MKDILFNTGETQRELREKYNPEGSHRRAIQLRYLEMLLYLDKICHDINIDYYLDYGTCLGAVRHGGFIPWDDDLDIGMDVKAYRKLCNYLMKHPHSQYVLQIRDTDEGFYAGWAKLRDLHSECIFKNMDIINQRQTMVQKYKGVSIDIFCYSDHVLQILSKPLHAIHYRITLRHLVGKYPLFANSLWFVCFKLLKPIANSLGLLFSKKNYVRHDIMSINTVHSFKKDQVYPLRDIEFEGHTFKVPNNTDHYLSIIYGDYNNLPPEERRNPHGFDYILK